MSKCSNLGIEKSPNSWFNDSYRSSKLKTKTIKIQVPIQGLWVNVTEPIKLFTVYFDIKIEQ